MKIIILLMLLCCFTLLPVLVQARPISHLEPGLDSGPVLMVITGPASKITTNGASISAEIFTREPNIEIFIEYTTIKPIWDAAKMRWNDSDSTWKNSKMQTVEQYNREFRDFTLGKLTPKTEYWYRCVARTEKSVSHGNINAFKTLP